MIEGIKIHNYILIEKLGEGGFARVYKAKHKHIDKIVALKVVKKGEFNTLQHESRVLLYLNSYYMNVFPLLHWFGRYGNLLCLATTYYSNNLRDFLHNSHQSLFYDTIKQMIDLCRKLHAVHIIHGDIKPDNFMINDKGFVTLVDFGMARSIENEGDNVHWTAFFGTPKYASPFVHSGFKPYKRDDMISLGFTILVLMQIELPLTRLLPDLLPICDEKMTPFFTHLYDTPLHKDPDYMFLTNLFF